MALQVLLFVVATELLIRAVAVAVAVALAHLVLLLLVVVQVGLVLQFLATHRTLHFQLAQA
jgi:hypothetical protein